MLIWSCFSFRNMIRMSLQGNISKQSLRIRKRKARGILRALKFQ